MRKQNISILSQPGREALTYSGCLPKETSKPMYIKRGKTSLAPSFKPQKCYSQNNLNKFEKT